jgi:hypothetical protein
MHGFIENKIYIKKETEASKLRMNGGAWTINLMEIGQLVDKHGYPEKMRIITEKHIYEIDYVDAFRENSFVKILGGEMKLVIPIKSWKVKEV